jgi:uroporphyrinogen decarboxylase
MKPDFNKLLNVFRHIPQKEPVLFEFFLNEKLYNYLAGEKISATHTTVEKLKIVIRAHLNAGYDYATVPASYTNTFSFVKGEVETMETKSLNAGFLIINREDFNSYPWADPDKGDYNFFLDLEEYLDPGMKLIACGPGGVLENVMDLTGFENLCIMALEDPELTKDIFDEVGSRLVRYYEICAKYDSVGALISNDDWGFKTQTMLPPDMLREFVFPWHEKIVQTIHKAGKPAILHSCGNLNEVMDDVIRDMKYDAKHSFEDEIIPVEEAYEKWGDRIAILGGIDLDFLVRSSREDIFKRSKSLLEQTRVRGGYALGSGNSIPHYVPFKNYFAMLSAAGIKIE